MSSDDVDKRNVLSSGQAPFFLEIAVVAEAICRAYATQSVYVLFSVHSLPPNTYPNILAHVALLTSIRVCRWHNRC